LKDQKKKPKMETAKKVVESAAEGVQKVAQSAAAKLQGSSSEAERSSGTMTKLTGCPVAHNKNSLTAGPTGPVMLQDHVLLEKVQQFGHEKTPPRNVHALGTGAYGHLRITNDISEYSKAKLFSKIGNQTNLLVRFSGVFTEQGDADTFRDLRGFALKFYTEEGNWDLLTINAPVFNCRDMKVGPDAIHAFKRDPRTGAWNPTQTWDFIAHHPEALHQAMMIYCDRVGTPMSFRYMHSYGCNTYSFWNAKNERFWVKFHLLACNGAKGLDQVQAKLIAGEDPNFLSRDLHEAIEKGNYPKWKLCCQVMPEAEGYRNSWTFDCTKIWKHSDYPLIEIGEIVLNKNPIDHFCEVEQTAFSPINVVPGIGFSPDKLLQGRLLVYDNTQYHRLGANFKQLPVNKPHACHTETYHVGGVHNFETKNRFPHYYPSSFGGPQPDEKYREPPYKTDGAADFYDFPHEGSYEDYYAQPADLWDRMNEIERMHLCQNIAATWEKVEEDIVQKNLAHFRKINTKFAESCEKLWKERKEGRTTRTEGEKVLEDLTKKLRIETSM